MNFTKESPEKNRSKKLLFAIKRRFRVPNVRYIREAFDFVYIRSSSLCIVVMATDMTDFMAQFYCRPIFVISRENRRWTQRNDWGKIGLRIKTMCARYIFFSKITRAKQSFDWYFSNYFNLCTNIGQYLPKRICFAFSSIYFSSESEIHITSPFPISSSMKFTLIWVPVCVWQATVQKIYK